MTCEHCAMNCTAQGEDMSWETFKRAIEMSGGYFTIGGGEPTLHPKFEKFLLHAIANADDQGMFIVTNGSITDRAMVLAKLAKAGVIGAALSQDPWHDPIDDKVVEAFTRDQNAARYGPDSHKYANDCREIRDVSHRVLRRGRAATDEFKYGEGYETHDQCACEGDPCVTPNGDVKQCGCVDAPVIGNVFDGWDGDVDEWVCHKEAA